MYTRVSELLIETFVNKEHQIARGCKTSNFNLISLIPISKLKSVFKCMYIFFEIKKRPEIRI